MKKTRKAICSPSENKGKPFENQGKRLEDHRQTKGNKGKPKKTLGQLKKTIGKQKKTVGQTRQCFRSYAEGYVRRYLIGNFRAKLKRYFRFRGYVTGYLDIILEGHQG